MNRRLLTYLLLDCSESMAGDPITAVQSGVASLVNTLKGDPQALETVSLSVITFASDARQVVPLTELLQFQMPKFQLGSGTALGSALTLWEQCIARDVVKTTPERKGDWKPLCFILTDGEPTDAWEEAAARARKCSATITAIACGPDADGIKLRRITDSVFFMEKTAPADFKKLFKFVSASVRVDPASPPVELKKMEAQNPQLPVDPDRQVFLHARCVKHKGFYLMRYAKIGGGRYRCAAVHKVDDFDFGSSSEMSKPKISNASMIDALPCPYCGHESWGMCKMGHVHCCPNFSEAVRLTCPWCGTTDNYKMGNFDVGRGAG